MRILVPARPAPLVDSCTIALMRFAPEPPAPAAHAARTAILLCNLGTPAAPTAAAVRPYLAEFLGDQRVVEIPRLLWWPILHGIILRLRPRASAEKYRQVWDQGGASGSPLLHWTQVQVRMLRGWLSHADAGGVLVAAAMRYGSPSIASQLDALKAQGAQRILILPLYPQYSCTTTASVCDAVYAWASTQRHIPELRFVQRYYDHPGYIAALAASVRAHWQDHGRAEKLLMSFHGVPLRTRTLGDPYIDECHATGQLLAQALGLSEQDYCITFQSRFGKAQWVEPYTQPTVEALARSGTRSLDVICPGFTSDCIETLEEINMEVRQAFLENGGQEYRYIPCLNDRADWITALRDIGLQHLQGWPVQG